MAFTLSIQPKAEKQLDRIQEMYRFRIRNDFVSIVNDPFVGKKLEGDLRGRHSIRVWPYRIIYSIYKKELVVSIVDVGHRQGVYKA